ncbi:MAG TPA: glucoamylase family protein [Verrucomicrobiae bacterium]|jgi:hypothetical protein
MKWRAILLPALIFIASLRPALAVDTPTNIVTRVGDKSVVLHWDQNTDTNLAGYRVYRSSRANGAFSLQDSKLLTSAGFCDLTAVNGRTNFYEIAVVDKKFHESARSAAVAAVANPFANTDQFLDFVQETDFDYFWYLANPTNGLVPDRSEPTSPCSIAAVGFGLTAIGIGIDHGWITRSQGAARVATTLNTFLQGPQGTNETGMMGYKGWFYHFLNMADGSRASASELSSIDTTLLLAGILYDKQYFDGTNAEETSIREMATAIFNRADWTWMSNETNAVCMAWYPVSGFVRNYWGGYCEGMIVYCLGLGSSTTPLPASTWNYWTSGYIWATNYGQTYVNFPPLFSYEFSHCWIDFRNIADSYMASHGTTYFENSRRAALAQVTYCGSSPNPAINVGYSSNVWGLTSSDDPSGYTAHGIPPPGFDNGTIAPTAAAGAIVFTPEFSVPTLNYFYNHYREQLWTAYGFRDAFNPGKGWYDADELGIDQGPVVIMIENYRTERPWKVFMRNPEVQTGLQRAGFVALPLANSRAQAKPE